MLESEQPISTELESWPDAHFWASGTGLASCLHDVDRLGGAPMLETGRAIAYTGQTLRVAGCLAGKLHWPSLMFPRSARCTPYPKSEENHERPI